MTHFVGADAILVAFAVAVYGVGAAALGVRRGRRDIVASAYAAVYTNFALLTIAALTMIVALVAHDFSVGYVAQVGSRSTPLFYTIISLWGALEGSILFWAWVLSMYSAAVVWFNRKREGALVPYAAAALLAIGMFFYILLIGPANPFMAVSPVPLDGPGPNPLLQNHILMAIHPPLLYLGYVGMSVPFAFAVGAMLSGEMEGEAWVRLTRRWTMTAWAFLSAAIVAGMWWSYEVLGWGGYWAWDPVENASFMPWLTATAFLHSVVVQERRGMLRLWNLNLVVVTFVLTILGTFLTRSGVLSSVHAFTQGTIGYYFLAFIAVVLLAALAMVAGNGDKLRGKGRLDAVLSRESVFLLNNLFLTAFTFTVLVGTLFPLVAEAVRGVKVSVGQPFYNMMTVPLCAALLFLMGVGPALPWKRISAADARRQLLAPAGGALIVAVIAILIGTREPMAVAAFAFAAFALVANSREFIAGALARVRAQGEALPVALVRLVGANRRRYGGYTAHVGVILAAVAITASSTFKTEQEATLQRGQTMTVRGFTVRLDELWAREEPQRAVVGAALTVVDGAREIGRLTPRLNYYRVQQQPVPTPAVRSRAAGDLYVNLMAFTPDGTQATLRVIVEPLVPWIWIGGGIVCLGALICMAPQRRRRVAATVPARTIGQVNPVPAYAVASGATSQSLEGAQP
jgi:cytochrome c-type biogenesis protein CcmF